MRIRSEITVGEGINKFIFPAVELYASEILVPTTAPFKVNGTDEPDEMSFRRTATKNVSSDPGCY